jgi:NADPH-dependent glutamate synthase beta subunit-like oxidoreductase/NAD(P)H-flavin reductase
MESKQKRKTGASGELCLGLEAFTYADLHSPSQLKRLSDRFNSEVASKNPALWASWDAYRRDPAAPRTAVEISALLVAMAAEVSRFIARLFQIEDEVDKLAAATELQDPIFRFKVNFVRRRVLPELKSIDVAADHDEIEKRVETLRRAAAGDDEPLNDIEMATARAAVSLMAAERVFGPKGSAEERAAVAPFLQRLGATSGDIPSWIGALMTWCAQRLRDPGHRNWVSFRFPEAVDHFNLVEIERPSSELQENIIGPEHRARRRDGFGLTDSRMSPREALSEIHYCILCHERDKDSCSKGLMSSNGDVTINALDIPLKGCPLEEKISEMHMLRKRGDAIGALALIMISNPMCPGTGHRICNDCMKSCIYQKQEPVNIPQIETAVLTDTLNLPWGVEIYGLLARWNPLNIARPHALPYNGKNILVVGLGPAGYTLAHYLINEGFGVAGVDGLKIEPIDPLLTGTSDTPPRPIRSWSEIYRNLDERVLEGFGGVSEYGITVRWDKNFLTLIHLTLARRNNMRIYGGVRFGGTFSIDDAWEYGFHHIAIAAGAGRPTIIDLKNNLACGIRKASDFLMALQLSGAFKRDALANLEARLPAIVIGGGLTAIDTATEFAAYYPVQVEKTLDRFEQLRKEIGEDRVLAPFNNAERAALQEFLTHGAAVRRERERAAAAGEKPDFAALVRSWGGVSIVYRKRLLDAPAYRLNHEEVVKALEEGIYFVENLNPEEALLDDGRRVRAVRFRSSDGRPVELPARSVLIAAGTTPNVTYEKEHPGAFRLDSKGKFFQSHRLRTGDDGTMTLEADPQGGGFFTSYNAHGRFISYYGDNHPRYAGNVVKAMASARDGYSHVAGLFRRELAAIDPAHQPDRDDAWRRFTKRLDHDWTARVWETRRLTPTIVEVIVEAPAAARKFEPGQFYRLQNFETSAQRARGTPLLMEGIALTGAWVDRTKGLLSLIALELGVSSRLVGRLRPGDPVIVMGPTGAPSEIGENENVLLAGGGLGNAVLFSIARAMRDRGNRVVYFAGYKKGEDLFKREEIEEGTDQVIWSTDTGAAIEPRRSQDRHFRGNIIQSILAYGRGELGGSRIPLSEIDRIIAIGSDRMMAAVRDARHGALQPLLKPGHAAIASINSPMQCMMKEVCAQCLQKHVDPVSGRETAVFSCLNQDQPMDHVDFGNLNSRLQQNAVQEKLSNLWLDHLLGAP